MTVSSESHFENQALAHNQARTEALLVSSEKAHIGAYRLEVYGTFMAQVQSGTPQIGLLIFHPVAIFWTEIFAGPFLRCSCLEEAHDLPCCGIRPVSFFEKIRSPLKKTSKAPGLPILIFAGILN
jgi:hypothetical protein